MGKISIGKKFTFDSAHKLKGEQFGKCCNLHGHTYLLEVIIEGEVNEQGVVFNFTDLKSIVNNKVISRLDHQILNDFISQPTAENIVIWIVNQIRSEIEVNGLKLRKVILYETPTSYVIWQA